LDDPYTAGLACLAAGSFSVYFSALRGALILYNPARLKEISVANPARHEAYLEENGLIEFTVLSLNGIGNAALALSVVSLVLALLPGGDVVSATGAALIGFAALLPALYLTNQFFPVPIVRWNSERIALHAMRTFYPVRWLFLPLYRVQERILHAVARLSGRDPEAAEEQELVDEIASVTEEGERGGVLEEGGAQMIKAIIRMQDHQVVEVMVPRIDIRSVSIHASLDEAAAFALEQGHSRIPVYREHMDSIVGVLYVKDLLQYWRHGDNGKRLAIEQVMRKPVFVPESMKILDLLRDFRKNKNHMAIVLDEYGGTAGLITIEDILEEIVGEIEDEYDLPTEEPLKLLDDGSADVDAKVHIDDLNDALNIRLDDTGDFDTIGGFVFSTLGKIPDPGESFVHGNIRFTVTEASDRRINRIHVTVLQDH